MRAANPQAQIHPRLVNEGEVVVTNPVRTEPTTKKKYVSKYRVSPRVQEYVWNEDEGVFDPEWLYQPTTPDKRYR